MANLGHCLARLTSWERTNCAIGTSNKRASIVKICRNIPEKGYSICQDCSGRPIGGKYQTRMLHGRLTEEPCEASHIYGSSWYWQQVATYGETDDKEWLVKAQKAQAEAEKFCESTDAKGSLKAWKVQRPSALELEEMSRKKKEENKAVAAASAKARADKKGTLLEKFAPIKVTYEESSKTPEKLATDTCSLWKDVIGGINVWISEAGHVFDCDTTGEAGELLGTMVDDKFVEVSSV